jgi:hypothetical protein
MDKILGRETNLLDQNIISGLTVDREQAFANVESFCVTCSGSFYLDKNFLNLAYGSADRDRISNAN